MSEMTATARAVGFDASHEVTAVDRRLDGALDRRQKLGQPVPLSNFVSDENNGVAQAAQVNSPVRFS